MTFGLGNFHGAIHRHSDSREGKYNKEARCVIPILNFYASSHHMVARSSTTQESSVLADSINWTSSAKNNSNNRAELEALTIYFWSEKARDRGKWRGSENSQMDRDMDECSCDEWWMRVNGGEDGR